MDDKRFETITKAMGRELTRRGALGRLVVGVATGLSATRATSTVAARNSNDQVCQELDSGKIDLDYGTKTLEICASAEDLCITGYCVKAGSKKQGLGPEFIDVDPPSHCVTISHSSGKDISHYSFMEEPCGEPVSCDGKLHNGRACEHSSECCSNCCVAPFTPNNPNRAFVCANAGGASAAVCVA